MNSSGIDNISDYLFDFARLNPDKPALLHPQRITFSKLCSMIDSYAVGFLKSGISKGTKTIVLINPCCDLFAVTYALLRIGSIPVLIDPGMGSIAMSKALSKVGADAFIGIPKAILLKYIFPMYFKTVKIWISTEHLWFWQVVSLKQFTGLQKDDYTPCKVDRNDPVAIFFTSGSTGPAKGVLYKSSMIEAQILFLKKHFKYNPDEIDLCTFPLIGLLIMCLGLSVVLADMDMTHPAKLNPAKLINNMHDFRCTYMFCSPLVLQKLAKFENTNKCKLSTLKRVMTAGAPISPQLLREFKKLLPDSAEIHTPYGATEALPVTDICDFELLQLYENSNNLFEGICVGYPLDEIDLQIIPISDTPVESWQYIQKLNRGEVGEIVVSGPNVTQEYIANDEANRKSKIFDSFIGIYRHRTGDLGRLDEQGRVWFYGRKSQRVESCEQIMFTLTCEAVFNQHPGVFRSALVGVKNKNKLIPVICIEPKFGIKGNQFLKKELLELAAENPLTKNIRIVLFHKKFPVDPRHNAKIFREKLVLWAQKRIK